LHRNESHTEESANQRRKDNGGGVAKWSTNYVSAAHVLSESIIERPLSQLRVSASRANERCKDEQRNI
jgi:hypothetical protein